MKKFLALGYMLALPLVSGAKILPSIVAILLFGAGGAFPTYAPALMGVLTTVFGYFVSGFFPTGGGISNFIMGL
jgi:hypothetical protein